MNLAEVWPASDPLLSPCVSPSAELKLTVPSRLPGRESFPVWDGLNFQLTQSTVIRTVASGTIIHLQPLTIAHAHNLLTRYHLPATDLTLGVHLLAGQMLATLSAGTTFKFELGLSLCALQQDRAHFMPLDPRELLYGYDSNSTFSTLWRGSVPLEAIPLFLQRAIVAVEDRRFYQHWGIDPFRIGRALINNLRYRQIREGASTITQQAARSALHITRRTWFRKLIEIPIALALEHFHDKNKILELYFDSIYWGRGATNVAAAAVDFFGKNVWALNLKECALLAALPNHPLRWEVTPADLERLEKKSEIVLQVMREQNVIDDTILNLARQQTYTLVKYL